MYIQETSFFSLPKHRTKLHWKLKSIQTSSESKLKKGFCPGVPVNKGITIVLSLFRSHSLAVVYCLVFCIGSCVPVHEDRTHRRNLLIDAFYK